MTLASLRREAAALLEKALIENPWLEVQVLAEHTLSLDRTAQLMDSGMEIEPAKANAFLKAVKERCRHVPTAYITGHREFYGLDFLVTRDTLVPRADSETLVEAALAHTRAGARVLDLCTGTGCIGLSIAASMPLSSLTLSDISPGALAVARENARRIMPDTEVRLNEGDLFSGLEGEVYDTIVSNPPYVRLDLRESLSEEVRMEPFLALHDRDEDAMGTLKRIIDKARCHLTKGGFLALECDYRQSEALVRIMAESGYSGCTAWKDLAGLERVVSGIWEGECTNS